jgi:hypothetical protein
VRCVMFDGFICYLCVVDEMTSILTKMMMMMMVMIMIIMMMSMMIVMVVMMIAIVTMIITILCGIPEEGLAPVVYFSILYSIAIFHISKSNTVVVNSLRITEPLNLPIIERFRDS